MTSLISRMGNTRSALIRTLTALASPRLSPPSLHPTLPDNDEPMFAESDEPHPGPVEGPATVKAFPKTSLSQPKQLAATQGSCDGCRGSHSDHM